MDGGRCPGLRSNVRADASEISRGLANAVQWGIAVELRNLAGASSFFSLSPSKGRVLGRGVHLHGSSLINGHGAMGRIGSIYDRTSLLYRCRDSVALQSTLHITRR